MAAPKPLPPNNIKVQIVDDDPFLSGMYKLGLERGGFTVFTAPDGESGIQAILQNQPDIVLLDLLMPKMDGFEVLEKLKSQPVTKGIPVVILSTLSQSEDIDRAIREGAADYFVKSQTLPFEAPVKIMKILKPKA